MNNRRNSFNENNSSKELILVMEKHGTTKIFFETEFPLISGLPGEGLSGRAEPDITTQTWKPLSGFLGSSYLRSIFRRGLPGEGGVKAVSSGTKRSSFLS